ncbi:MAG: cytochrome c biogenesis protein ResB [Phycisphaerales bacterium]
MKPVQKWHFTPFGRAALFLGSIQLAVPVMVAVAIAMAWGTYLESRHNVQVSRATVYGSWWFIVLMALICVSLVFAVVTRYPWKRKHVGFITVHTGLVMLIAGGFWSLFGRIEGHIGLDEGASSNLLETDREILALSEFKSANEQALAEVTAPHGPASLTLAGLQVKVTDFWDNCTQEQYVANDAPQPFRAVELTLGPANPPGQWVGEEARGGAAATVDGVTVRVLADGADWTPPSAPAGTDYFFTHGGKQFPVPRPGEEVFPGWKAASVQRFTKATVADGVLTDSGTQENPAIEVTITNGQGTTERHRCFRNFPDMVMTSVLEGSARSDATLGATPAIKLQEVLTIYGPVASPRVGYTDYRGNGRELPTSGDGRTYEAGKHRFVILNQYANARSATRLVRAPMGPDRRPALVLDLPGRATPAIVPWKGFETLTDPSGRTLLVSYGPKFVELPFTIHLKDFRKMDYPGTEMAMAYESEVLITSPGAADTPFLIHMNSPYAAYPWKVYQSGFAGESTSIFSVMRDPGLKATYLGSAVLCVGIFLTFFSRSFSWGHPGIPAPHLHETPPPPTPR